MSLIVAPCPCFLYTCCLNNTYHTCALLYSAYQGRERDLIIFSAVRSNRQGRIGFLSDWRRMNVALTRAKSGLVVLGDAETLKDGDRHWSAFVHWCEQMDCLVE